MDLSIHVRAPQMASQDILCQHTYLTKVAAAFSYTTQINLHALVHLRDTASNLVWRQC